MKKKKLQIDIRSLYISPDLYFECVSDKQKIKIMSEMFEIGIKNGGIEPSMFLHYLIRNHIYSVAKGTDKYVNVINESNKALKMYNLFITEAEFFEAWTFADPQFVMDKIGISYNDIVTSLINSRWASEYKYPDISL